MNSIASNINPSLRDFDELPSSGFVRLPVVVSLLGVSPATVWRNVKNGNLPKPKKLTPRTTVWNVGELREAMACKGN
jgi:predicted DNA-binding transcriptional regulator AlpA